MASNPASSPDSLSSAEVRRQVEAITSSPVLANSLQLCRFLRYVVERTLAGDTGSLKESLLGTEVFDRGIRYDPRTDPVVRVEARRLRAKLEEYYATHGAQAAVMIDLPRGTYVPAFSARTRSRVVTMGRASEQSRSPESSQQPTAVAVLPFASVGADPETEYFSDGLTDEVMTLLGTVPGLHVVARSSVYRFKGRTEDARELGQLLNASHLVEGSVRRHGERMRIAVQLVESANGYQAWTQTFERDWRHIFAIQTEIATAIASTLRLRTTGDAAPRSALYTENLEAYNAVLKGRFHIAKRSVPGFHSAMEAFRQAIALDAGYAPAWAGLADCHSMLGFLNASSPVESRLQARQAAERAVALDDNLSAAHVALGTQIAIYEWDWEAGMAALRRGAELDPGNSLAHYSLSKLLASVGRAEEALPLMQRAQELDPVSPIISASLAWELGLLGRYEEADEVFNAARELNPGFVWTWVLQAWSFETRGMLDEAIRSLRHAATLLDSSVVQGELAHALGKNGQLDEARQCLDALLDLANTGFVSPFDLARAWEGVGDRDKSLEHMSLACDQRTPLLLFAGADPVFDPFRNEPRFQEILRRMNLEGARNAAIGTRSATAAQI